MCDEVEFNGFFMCGWAVITGMILCVVDNDTWFGIVCGTLVISGLVLCLVGQ